MDELASYFLNTFIAIFVIVDPFALVPVYLTLTERFSPLERKITRRKATMIAVGILILFALSGLSIFNLFGITLPAFQIAGGLLLLFFGITQLSANRVRVTKKEKEEGLEKDDISIFPLATPLLAGPGAISTIVLMSSKAHDMPHMVVLIVAICSVLFTCHLFLRIAPFVFKFMGRTGLNLITRIMGIIVTAIAVQFVINGIKAAFSLN